MLDLPASHPGRVALRLMVLLSILALLAGCMALDPALPAESTATPMPQNGTVPSTSGGIDADPSRAQDPATAELIPLALENRWDYRDLLSDGTVTNRVDVAHLVGNDTWFRIDEFNGFVWVRNVEGGQLDALYADEETLNEAEAAKAELFFRHPLEHGTEYVPFADEIGVMSYSVLDDPCRVPAGDFTCVRFVLTEPELALTWHIAPGVGIVEHTYSEGEELIEHWVLTAYALKQE